MSDTILDVSTLNHGSDRVFDASFTKTVAHCFNGCDTGSIEAQDIASELVRRWNMHDEFVEFRKELLMLLATDGVRHGVARYGDEKRLDAVIEKLQDLGKEGEG